MPRPTLITASREQQPELIRLTVVFLTTALGLAVCSWLVARVTTPDWITSDEFSYLSMASGSSTETVPYSRRVLTPYLVSLLPLPLRSGFLLVTVLSLALATALLDYHLRSCGLSKSAAKTGLVLWLGMFYPAWYSLQHPMMIDPLFLVFWIGGIIAILRDNSLLLSVIVAAGTLDKEVALLLVPIAFLTRVSRSSFGNRALRSGLVILPGILIYVLLARAHPPREPAEYSAALLAASFGHVFSLAHLRVALSGILLSGGPLWPMLPFGWRRASPLARRLLVAATVCILPLTMVAADTGRMVALLAPFWIPVVVTAYRLDEQAGRARLISVPIVAGSACLLVATLLALPSAQELVLRVVGVAMFLFPLAVVIRHNLSTARHMGL